MHTLTFLATSALLIINVLNRYLQGGILIYSQLMHGCWELKNWRRRFVVTTDCISQNKIT
jgi:hypothetical protein